LDIDDMTGPEFEAYVGGVLRCHGYVVSGTKASRDFGVDLVASKGDETLAVQCKRQFKLVGGVAVQEVVAGALMYGCTSTMVVSNQSFTAGAVALAQRNNCTLIDGVTLSQLAADYAPEPMPSVSDRNWELIERRMRLERFRPNARASVVRAQEEARDLNSDTIRPEHLLLGVLQSAGRNLALLLVGYGLTAQAVRGRVKAVGSQDDEAFEADAAALRTIGIDLHAVRDTVVRALGADAWNNALRDSSRHRRGPIPFTKPAKKVLELSLREALAHKDSTIGCEHILLGILRGGDKFTLGLVTEHVETSQLRDAIIGLLDAAA
jgi:hypothetical protein